MRGHEAVIALRLKGYAPDDVHIDFDVRLPSDGTHAHVLIEPSDAISLLDLRFLVGLTVFVHGDDQARTENTVTACVQARAARVISFCGDEIRDTNHASAVA